MTFLSFYLAFGLLAMLHGVLDSKFKLCAFYCQWTHQGEIEKPNGQFHDLICDESLTCRDLNSNPGHFGSFTFTFVHVENHVCLSRGMQVVGAAWQATIRIVVGVGDLMQRAEDGHAQVGYSMAG
jgi:hypothetical protein